MPVVRVALASVIVADGGGSEMIVPPWPSDESVKFAVGIVAVRESDGVDGDGPTSRMVSVPPVLAPLLS